ITRSAGALTAETGCAHSPSWWIAAPAAAALDSSQLPTLGRRVFIAGLLWRGGKSPPLSVIRIMTNSAHVNHGGDNEYRRLQVFRTCARRRGAGGLGLRACRSPAVSV